MPEFSYLLDAFGLLLNITGVLVLLWYAEKTRGGLTPADQDEILSRDWFRLSIGLLILGFLLQFVVDVLNYLSL